MEFRLPELGEGVNEGELIKWMIKPGDTVKDDQPLCEIMTDKATMEIPSHFNGVVKELHAKEGETVKVHQLMLTAEEAGAVKSASSSTASSNASASAAPAAKGPAPSAPQTVAAPSLAKTNAPVAPAKNSADVLASPATRRLANEKGIDLGSIAASGPHGRVLLEDLERALSGGASGSSSASKSAPKVWAANGEVTRTPIRGLRKKIAEKMHQSKTTAAHFTYVEECDATELVKLRTQAKVIAEKRGIKLTYLPFILKAMVEAGKQHPRINSTVDDAAQELITYPYFNISLSVQTEDGLSVPVVKNVEQKSIFELAIEIADIVDRARKKKLTMADFQGSTLTLTNAGSIGGLFATPIINYPEVAILGFNKIARKPVVKVIGGREKIVVRDWTYFSISMDHRMLDGAEAAEFLKTFISYIENPSLLFLDQL
jgi:pyruvate dehydrogenase E2 component (dihydrolipoamide acetyltransferase)